MRFLCTILLACCAVSLTILRESSALPAPRPAPADGLNTLDDSTIIVPVARNFSSLKELFQILHEDRSKYPSGAGANVLEGKDLDLARVNGSLTKDDSFVIFVSD